MSRGLWLGLHQSSSRPITAGGGLAIARVKCDHWVAVRSLRAGGGPNKGETQVGRGGIGVQGGRRSVEIRGWKLRKKTFVEIGNYWHIYLQINGELWQTTKTSYIEGISFFLPSSIFLSLKTPTAICRNVRCVNILFAVSSVIYIITLCSICFFLLKLPVFSTSLEICLKQLGKDSFPVNSRWCHDLLWARSFAVLE